MDRYNSQYEEYDGIQVEHIETIEITAAADEDLPFYKLFDILMFGLAAAIIWLGAVASLIMIY